MRYSTPTVLYDGLHAYQTPEYSSWLNMVNRCKKGYKEAKFYSAKGVKVCERWSSDSAFLNFFKDMGRKPSPEHTLDRVDASLDYTPENCRWATKRQQAINRKLPETNTSGYRGVSLYRSSGKWRAGIDRIALGYYTTKEDAALAYDCAAIQLHGNEARLNILGAK